MMPLCRAEGIAVIPWSPLARGRLTRAWKSETTRRSQTDEFGNSMYTRTEEADQKGRRPAGRGGRKARHSPRASRAGVAAGQARRDRAHCGSQPAAPPGRRRGRARRAPDRGRDVCARGAVHSASGAWIQLINGSSRKIIESPKPPEEARYFDTVTIRGPADPRQGCGGRRCGAGAGAPGQERRPAGRESGGYRGHDPGQARRLSPSLPTEPANQSHRHRRPRPDRPAMKLIYTERLETVREFSTPSSSPITSCSTWCRWPSTASCW